MFKSPGHSHRSGVPPACGSLFFAWADWFAQSKWQEDAGQENDKYFQGHGADDGKDGDFFKVVPWEVAGNSETDEFGKVHDIKVQVCTHNDESVLTIEGK